MRRQTRHSLAGQSLEPLSLRALQAAGVLSLLLILVVANSLLAGGGESPFDPNPVAAAAERTAEVPGMRMSMTMTVSTAANPPVTISGSGIYNGEANLAEITYHATTSPGQSLEFQAIVGEDGWFFHYPQFAGKLPEGKEWIKLEGLPGQKDLSTPETGSPEESLQMLRSTGSVRRLGKAEVGGTQTTRYRLTIPPTALVQRLRAEGKDELAEQVEGGAAQMVGPVHAEVFIAKSGLLRRMHIVTTVLANGQRATSDIRMDLSGFGIKPNIFVPDDSQVLDLSPLLEEKLEALGQAS